MNRLAVKMLIVLIVFVKYAVLTKIIHRHVFIIKVNSFSYPGRLCEGTAPLPKYSRQISSGKEGMPPLKIQVTRFPKIML